MKTQNTAQSTGKILWKGKTGVSPNIYGLDHEGGRLGFSLTNGAGHNHKFGTLAGILWGLIF